MCGEPGDRKGLLSEDLDPGSLCPLQLHSLNFPCSHFQGHEGRISAELEDPSSLQVMGVPAPAPGWGIPMPHPTEGGNRTQRPGELPQREGAGARRFGGGLWLFLVSRCALRKLFQLSRSFSGWAGGGDAIYRRGERGAAESGVRPRLGSVSPVPAPARPGPGEGRGQPG